MGVGKGGMSLRGPEDITGGRERVLCGLTYFDSATKLTVQIHTDIGNEIESCITYISVEKF
jgi:hypothetical protein